MDMLHLAIFTLALGLGLIQHLLDDAPAPVATTHAPRWSANAMLFAADVASVTLFAAALTWATQAGATALPRIAPITTLPVPVQVALLLLAQSLALYWVHRAGHKVPMLWSWHRIHHSDTHLDATTGLRHHPFDSMLSHLALLVPTAMFMPSAAAVFATLLISTFFALFTHMNPDWLPARLDRALASVIMTPRLHRLHHSAWQPETDTNYGTILIVWDRVFGTYHPAPTTPRIGFGVGLVEFPPQKAQDAAVLFAAPFLPHDLREAATVPD